MEEAREKIELFRNYYLVCFRSFDQDPYSPTYLEPLNMYIIVFREGILSVRPFFFVMQVPCFQLTLRLWVSSTFAQRHTRRTYAVGSNNSRTTSTSRRTGFHMP